MQNQSGRPLSALNDEFGIIIYGKDLASLAELTSADMRGLLSSHSAMLFRDFNITDDNFQELARTLGGDFVSHGAPSRPSVSEDGMLHLANPGTAALNLHTELGYFPLPPDYLWFHCVVPAGSEGGTQVCDGQIVAEKLSADFHNLFAERKLKYSAFWPQEQWCRYFQTTSKDKVISVLSSIDGVKSQFLGSRLILDYVVDAFHTSSEGKKIFANSMLHYCLDGFAEFLTLDNDVPIPNWAVEEAYLVSNAHMQEVSWNKNDLLLLDNKRIMHGRKGHSDPERKLTVRMQRLS